MKALNKKYYNTSKTKIKLNFWTNTLAIFVNIFKILSERVLSSMTSVVRFNNFKKVKNELIHIINKLKHYTQKLWQPFSLREDT
jgi:hypothetical protein